MGRTQENLHFTCVLACIFKFLEHLIVNKARKEKESPIAGTEGFTFNRKWRIIWKDESEVVHLKERKKQGTVNKEKKKKSTREAKIKVYPSINSRNTICQNVNIHLL
jgi:hypothetical protein